MTARGVVPGPAAPHTCRSGGAARWLRRTAGAVLALAALAGGPDGAAAQETRADTAAVLLDVASQLEREGRGELASALYRLVLERYPGTLAAQEAERRTRLGALPRARMGGDGRAELIVAGTLYGLWLGFAAPFILDADDPAAYGAGFLIGGPGGFLLAKNYVDRSLRGEAHARAISFGGLWGGWQGFGWKEVLTDQFGGACLDEPVRDECYYDGDDDGSDRVLWATLGSAAGIVAGDLIARRSRPTPGAVATTNLAALWGTGYGWTSAFLLDQEDGDAPLAWALLGGNLGLGAGALLASRADVTREQARLTSIAGVAGAVAGLGIDLLLQPDDEDVAILIPMATSATGLVLGWRWARGRDAAPGRDDDGAGALLRVEDGRLGLGTPVPMPVRVAGPRGTEATALRLELLRARF